MKKAPKIPEKTKSPAKANKKMPGTIFTAILAAFIIILAYGGIKAILFSPESPNMFVESQALATDENVLFSYEINRYPASAEISNLSGPNITMGFALDPGSINFGIVPGGGNIGKRFITLQNTAEAPSKITLKAYGTIAPLIKFSGNNFLLSKGAPKPVEISLETQNNTLLGNYSGEIDIIVKKPKYAIAARLL